MSKRLSISQTKKEDKGLKELLRERDRIYEELGKVNEKICSYGKETGDIEDHIIFAIKTDTEDKMSGSMASILMCARCLDKKNRKKMRRAFPKLMKFLDTHKWA